MPSVKSTAPPPITQPPATQAEEPPKPIEKLGVSVEEISSENENLPYGLSVIISTTVVISPVNMEVVCSGPIGSARVSFSPPPGASAFASNMFGLGRQIDGNILRFSFAGPPFTPRGPLEVKVFSAHKIRVLMVKRLD
jgi:hypothetical protein